MTDSSYRALIVRAMDAVRWSSLEKAAAFRKAQGLVLSVGSLPFASDRAGRDDPRLDALVTATFPDENRLAKPADVLPTILKAFTPDTRAPKPVRSLHRKLGARDVYMVMDAPKNSVGPLPDREEVAGVETTLSKLTRVDPRPFPTISSARVGLGAAPLIGYAPALEAQTTMQSTTEKR